MPDSTTFNIKYRYLVPNVRINSARRNSTHMYEPPGRESRGPQSSKRLLGRPSMDSPSPIPQLLLSLLDFLNLDLRNHHCLGVTQRSTVQNRPRSEETRLHLETTRAVGWNFFFKGDSRVILPHSGSKGWAFQIFSQNVLAKLGF